MNKNYFILGTSTDVGKTYVASLIVKKLHLLNKNVGYYKPCMSGVTIENSLNDIDYVVNVAQIARDKAKVSFQYDLPLSPHLASKGLLQFDIGQALNDYNCLSKDIDYLIVEGCGGVVCPLSIQENKIMLIDVVKSIDIPVVLVANSGLGSINATCLAIDYLKNNNINIQGIIMNNYDKSNPMHIDNAIMIESLTNVGIVARVGKDDKDIDIDKLL